MFRWPLVLAFILITGSAAFAEEMPGETDQKKPDTNKKEAPKTEKKFANPVPGKCPVMPEEDADPDISVEVDGKLYSFCCNKCLRVFQANPDKYLKKADKKEEKKDEKKDK
jgi:YHS domain-containing protein